MRRAALLAALLAAGCSAQMVETRKRRDGVVKEIGALDAGGGHLKYSLKGPGFVVRARRKDAFERMAAQCGGAEKFKIVDEVERQEAEASYAGPGGELEEAANRSSRHYDIGMNQHVFFECLP